MAPLVAGAYDGLFNANSVVPGCRIGQMARPSLARPGVRTGHWPGLSD
jgi:hypothetical protein